MEPRCVPQVSLDRVRWPTLRFPPQGPPGRVPLLRRYSQSATTSCRPSRRASLPSLGGTSVALVRFAPPADECAARGLELVTRWLPPGYTEETTGLPSSWGTPIVRLPMFSRLRRDCPRQTITARQRGPWYPKSKGSHERVFEAQLHGVRTGCGHRAKHGRLRSEGYPTPRKTRLRPLVRRYRAGFPPARFQRKVSDQPPFISSPFPKLLGAIGSTEVLVVRREPIEKMPTFNGTVLSSIFATLSFGRDRLRVDHAVVWCSQCEGDRPALLVAAGDHRRVFGDRAPHDIPRREAGGRDERRAGRKHLPGFERFQVQPPRATILKSRACSNTGIASRFRLNRPNDAPMTVSRSDFVTGSSANLVSKLLHRGIESFDDGDGTSVALLHLGKSNSTLG